MPDTLGLSSRLGLCLALAGVMACGKAPAPPVAGRLPARSADTVRLAEGDSLRTSAGLVVVLQDVVIKLRPPDRRSVLRASVTLRDSSGSEDRSLLSDEGWARALGWEIDLLTGSDTSVALAIRRAPADPPAVRDSAQDAGPGSE